MSERIGLYAGSFDPVTNGHLDIIRRASKLFDKVIVATMTNTKKTYLFNYEEKKSFIENEISDLDNVIVIDGKDQLTTGLAKKYNARFLVRSMRNSDDFGYESGVATINKVLDDDIETVFLLADYRYTNISSSMIKEVARFDGDISQLVPELVAQELKKRLRKVN
ncbi:pantetheine-phosphate adenylyltransferase [Companilactobacillus mishanensis]|uniref:Phosphopantetheine adenylyltransferase n=1 Tax=Companilactobacillus mishanensis TaxID=2486008 RepID=A0A5P0ZGY5_9LACO|nr:pantetheine-phosphate adenylyltransferase [Companilactobacillus mishanensis]MQS44085.1 pantetheine-phosphate adenylyltransferase [Companilactobacillus mishanensis]MQS52294.1 pantetheine-phosphate adenylyltransferase [Companilactobacillus mishanensis]MQS88384.1 pantetheine-phosphate adenylyltransferase [Companilactobacillus mishanensis]